MSEIRPSAVTAGGKRAKLELIRVKGPRWKIHQLCGRCCWRLSFPCLTDSTQFFSCFFFFFNIWKKFQSTEHWIVTEGNAILGFLCKPYYSSSVWSLGRVQLLATPWTAAHQASLPITNSRGLLKLMSIKPVMPSNHLFFCRLILLRTIQKKAEPASTSLCSPTLPKRWCAFQTSHTLMITRTTCTKARCRTT